MYVNETVLYVVLLAGFITGLVARGWFDITMSRWSATRSRVLARKLSIERVGDVAIVQLEIGLGRVVEYEVQWRDVQGPAEDSEDSDGNVVRFPHRNPFEGDR